MEALASNRRFALALAAAVLGIALVGGFAWRVAHFAELIRTGELRPGDLAYLSRFTPSVLASALPVDLTKAAQVTSASAPSLGVAGGKLTIVEFADFQCPFSKQSSGILRALAAQYGDRIRYEYREFPLPEIHEDALLASMAARCAHRQGKFWEYHDKLYLSTSDLGETRLKAVAREVNLDGTAFDRCLDARETQGEVEADMVAGLEAGVRGTPTFFLNGTMIPGSIPEDALRNLIERSLAS